MNKPYYDEGGITIYHGDCRNICPLMPPVDVVITDPPYGTTSLSWDQIVTDWEHLLNADSLWCFGSMRFFMAERFDTWKYAQEIIWEKHNGSGFHADRFRRVHEFAVHFYRGNWATVYKSPVFTMDATKRTVRRKERPAHMGDIERGAYASEDGGPKLMRSVIYAASCHGIAEHPTQKPLQIIAPLLDYSCPPGGTILDPFMGSGSTLVVAKERGCSAIGIDIREECCEIAATRLAQAVLAL